MAVLMPLFLLLFSAAIALGRTAGAIGAVEMAAYDGARTASLARDGGAAGVAAREAVASSLAAQGYACRGGPMVTVDTEGYAEPVGTPASVAVRVDCRVSYADLGVLRLGDRVVSAGFVSPLDRYRGRG
jgi:hypothetical protein